MSNKYREIDTKLLTILPLALAEPVDRIGQSSAPMLATDTVALGIALGFLFWF